jgi:hypothetical protein
MEPEGSLPRSQEPSTGPYPEPDRSNPYQPILSLVRSILILSTHLRLGLPSGLLHLPKTQNKNELFCCTEVEIIYETHQGILCLASFLSRIRCILHVRHLSEITLN